MRVGQRVVLVKDDPPALQAGDRGTVMGRSRDHPHYLAVVWDKPSKYRHSCQGLTPNDVGWWALEQDLRFLFTNPLHESIQAYIQKELAP